MTPILDSVHPQQWVFERFSYLEQPRPTHGLLLMLSGSIDYIGTQGVLHLQPMDLVYLPKGSRYEARFRPGTEDLLLNFNIVDAGEDLPTAPCLVTRDSQHSLQPLMERTVRSFLEPQRLEAMSHFYMFCHHLDQLLKAGNDGPALISRAKALLSEPDCESVEAVARQLLVSPSGLRKKFKDAEGVSPARYRLLQKVENAKRQLLSTDLPIGAIADRCGFCDSAYFHKVFCRLAGTTPTAYRQAHKQL